MPAFAYAQDTSAARQGPVMRSGRRVCLRARLTALFLNRWGRSGAGVSRSLRPFTFWLGPLRDGDGATPEPGRVFNGLAGPLTPKSNPGRFLDLPEPAAPVIRPQPPAEPPLPLPPVKTPYNKGQSGLLGR